MNSPDVRSILVVDDDVSLTAALQRLLANDGYDVTTAASAGTAVAAVARGSFQAVLSDIGLPDRTGLELLREVRNHDLDLPVILMTGAPSIETAVAAVSLGALEYLQKPIDKAALQRAVQKATHLYRMSPGTSGTSRGGRLRVHHRAASRSSPAPASPHTSRAGSLLDHI
jgi:DNA-binding NtrC family response regulator